MIARELWDAEQVRKAEIARLEEEERARTAEIERQQSEAEAAHQRAIEDQRRFLEEAEKKEELEAARVDAYFGVAARASGP